MGVSFGRQVCAGRDCQGSVKRFRLPWHRPEGIRLKAAWYCGSECFEQALHEAILRLLALRTQPPSRPNRIPLGLLMLSLGFINDQQLKQGIEAQRQSGVPHIGEVLRKLGVVSESQVTAALSVQWSCPVFPLRQLSEFAAYANLAPFVLLERHRMVPVHYISATEVLYVAFADGVDHRALFAIEQMLGARTQPCIGEASALERILEDWRNRPRPTEMLFEGITDAAQIARMATNYAVQLEALEANLASCADYVWLRLQRPPTKTDLLFRIASDTKSGFSAELPTG